MEARREGAKPLLRAVSTPGSPRWPPASLLLQVPAEFCPCQHRPREASRTSWLLLVPALRMQKTPLALIPFHGAHRASLQAAVPAVPPRVSRKSRVAGCAPLQALPRSQPWGRWDMSEDLFKLLQQHVCQATSCPLTQLVS